MAAFPDAEVLDITGPLDVFSIAGRVLTARKGTCSPYSIEIAASQAGAVTTSSGIRLVADRPFREVRGHVDTLIVPGGIGTSQAMADSNLTGWVRSMATRARRVCSVCTGAFFRAVAGLLDGRSATTHWRWCGQSQFSAQLSSQLASRHPIRELQAWIADNLDGDLSIDAMAARAAMSSRNFARVFRRETGMTPAHFVEVSRVEAARTRLEESTDAIDAIGADCGFGTRESMRRAFLRTLRVPPASYRNRFRRLAEPVILSRHARHTA